MEKKLYRGIPYKGNENLARALFYLYKDYILSLIFITAGIFFILVFLIPQIQVWFKLQGEARELNLVNAVLKDNLTLISSLNEKRIDEDVRIVASALPVDKEFASVLNSISAASAKSAIGLGDYNFQVGELATKSAKIGLIKRPSINISLAFTADANSIERFIGNLYNQVPLVEANEISYTNTASYANFDFYYKPFSAIQTDFKKPMLKLAGKEQIVLETISQWVRESNPENLSLF